MGETVRAAIIGVSGYAGGELARLLARHPNIELTFLSSETYAGKPLTKAFPGLSGTRAGTLICQKTEIGRAAEVADVVFLAQENGAAMQSVPTIRDVGKRVVDISADFRLRNADEYARWYKMPHTAQTLLETAVFGLTEWNRSAIAGAKLLANPGCYPTASLLALIPLLQSGRVQASGIIVDAKSGVSGAGRAKSDLLYKFSEANESVTAYGVGGTHRHTPEIEQGLMLFARTNTKITFTPHLIPMTRGILTTVYAQLMQDATTDEILALYRDAYADSPFVVVRNKGEFPATKDVSGSNYCHIGAAVDERTGRVVVVSVIDNLIKGAAGQAVQNMNVMFGLPETAGLEGGGLWP